MQQCHPSAYKMPRSRHLMAACDQRLTAIAGPVVIGAPKLSFKTASSK